VTMMRNSSVVIFLNLLDLIHQFATFLVAISSANTRLAGLAYNNFKKRKLTLDNQGALVYNCSIETNRTT